MANPSADIRKILIERLAAQGVDACLIPGLLRLIASAISAEPHPNREIVSRRLKFLGWGDFELDEHTFQLALACLEEEAAKSTADILLDLERTLEPSR